jgi:hypothetical protein
MTYDTDYQRDSIPDRIGNVLRKIGFWASTMTVAVSLGMWGRGEMPFDATTGQALNFANMVLLSVVVYSLFRTVDYLITGRR